jgi:hypothetical protein
MELSNYRVEILGGKHLSNDDRERGSSTLYKSSPFGFAPSWSPWSSLWSSTKLFETNPEYPNDRSYVEMRDGDSYAINLRNGNFTRCHAKVSIDGNCVGTWLIPGYGSIQIERPVDVPKKFTFFKVNSQAGREAGLVARDSNNGLISVEFIPEKKTRSSWNCFGSDSRASRYDDADDFDFLDSSLYNNQQENLGGFRPLNLSKGGRHRAGRNACIRNDTSSRGYFSSHTDNGYEEGGTGLKGKSNQDFTIARDQLELDPDNKVTINLRLIAKKDCVDYDSITPLSGPRSNPVPKPLFI